MKLEHFCGNSGVPVSFGPRFWSVAEWQGHTLPNFGMHKMADNLTPEQRRYCMSRVKGKDTGLEILVRSELHRKGFRFRKHVKDLPGKPDVVFVTAKVAVFIDGDFWHGYKFTSWEHKVSEFWKSKIWKNIERDITNRRKLRDMGWKVIRLWQHEIEENIEASINRIVSAVLKRRVAPNVHHQNAG